jgi:hypothetical protein
MTSPTPDGQQAGSFGLEAFTQDDRLRLFSFANAEKSNLYLWALRAFERARANYVVLLHAGDVAGSLIELGVDYQGQADVPRLTVEELTPLLDQLYLWQLLDRSYDGARAASLAEYRNRHYVYQFTQAGYRAYRAVEDVLGARMDDATLSRLVLPELLADLEELAAANADGDSEMVYRKLNRLDATLDEMAGRAARFYLMLSDLARTNESSAEIFLAHKDALLSHMREFSSELARYAPRLAAGVRAVEATGAQRLIELAAEADDRIFRSPAERIADWRQRWSGLGHWFTAAPEEARRSEADRLQTARSVRSPPCCRCCAGSPRPGAAESAERVNSGTWPPGWWPLPIWSALMRCSTSPSTSAAHGTSAWSTQILNSFRPAAPGGRPLRSRCPGRWSRPAERQAPGPLAGWIATTPPAGGCGTPRSPGSEAARLRPGRWPRQVSRAAC